MAMNVGTSIRTWLKHAAMYGFVDKEVNALSTSKMGWVAASDWFDLTAGNGLAVDTEGQYVPDADTSVWVRHCSPGILTGAAMRSYKPVTVVMYENDQETYSLLSEQLQIHLPRLGYKADTESTWVGISEHGQRVHVSAFFKSGHTATIDHVQRNHFVLAFNDGNAVTQWAVPPGFSDDIMEITKYLRMFHAIGANANGVKRGKDVEFRQQWFQYLQTECDALRGDHDLLLCRLQRDSHQWAYMERTSARFRTETESRMRKAFRDWPHGVEMAWRLDEPERFDRITSKLFSTSSEYQYAELVGENLCLF